MLVLWVVEHTLFKTGLSNRDQKFQMNRLHMHSISTNSAILISLGKNVLLGNFIEFSSNKSKTTNNHNRLSSKTNKTSAYQCTEHSKHINTLNKWIWQLLQYLWPKWKTNNALFWLKRERKQFLVGFLSVSLINFRQQFWCAHTGNYKYRGRKRRPQTNGFS